MFTPFDSGIMVGHSLFFQAFFTRFMSEEFKTSNPELSSKLIKSKMNNAAVACVQLDLANTLKPVISDMSFLFGSGFSAHGH